MLFCVHLPGIVGRGRSPRTHPRPPPRRRRGQVATHEPALKGAFRGNRTIRDLLEQMDSDQSGPPGGVLAAQGEGGLHDVGGRDRCGRSIRSRKARDAVAANPLEQPIDRRDGELERLGDPKDRIPPLPKPEGHLADRLRDGTWHHWTPWFEEQGADHTTVYQCHVFLKPGVGISFSNPVSRDTKLSPGWLGFREERLGGAAPHPKSCRGVEDHEP
jgi:hypothetical protein